MKKLLNITCLEATYLISKKEDSPIGFVNTIKLKLHQYICSVCKLFEQQLWFMKINANHNHEHLDVTLSETAKEKMDFALKSIQ